MLPLTHFLNHTIAGSRSFKAAQGVLQRLILFDLDLAHLIPSPPLIQQGFHDFVQTQPADTASGSTVNIIHVVRLIVKCPGVAIKKFMEKAKSAFSLKDLTST